VTYPQTVPAVPADAVLLDGRPLPEEPDMTEITADHISKAWIALAAQATTPMTPDQLKAWAKAQLGVEQFDSRQAEVDAIALVANDLPSAADSISLAGAGGLTLDEIDTIDANTEVMRICAQYGLNVDAAMASMSPTQFTDPVPEPVRMADPTPEQARESLRLAGIDLGPGSRPIYGSLIEADPEPPASAPVQLTTAAEVEDEVNRLVLVGTPRQSLSGDRHGPPHKHRGHPDHTHDCGDPDCDGDPSFDHEAEVERYVSMLKAEQGTPEDDGSNVKGLKHPPGPVGQRTKGPWHSDHYDREKIPAVPSRTGAGGASGGGREAAIAGHYGAQG
jgi:hypothetical protein